MKKFLLFTLAMLICLTVFSGCSGTKKTLGEFSSALTVVPGEEIPEPVELEPIDYRMVTEEELNGYMSDMNALKEEITSSKSHIEIPDGANVYYVSNNGNNDNDGLSPETAWESVSKANRKAVRDGDIVLFECGSIFRENLSLSQGVKYSSYGEGEKPRFYGSWDGTGADKWIETDVPNIYRYYKSVATELDVGQIIFNGGDAWGIKVMKLNDEDKRVDQGECFNGIESFNHGQETFANYKDLKSNLEFYCDPSTLEMHIYCSYGNPGEYFDSVELAKKGNICKGSAKDVVVDNLVFMYGGSHGIGVSNSVNFTVQYCEFYYIGGSVQGYNLFSRSQPTRFGNAVENWTNCNNFTIDHCYASQIYDCCFTTQWQGDSNGADVIMKDVVFSNNVSEYANTGLEVWMSDNVGYPDATYKFVNFDCYGNYTYNNGFGWSHQRPNKDANFFYGGTNTNSTQHENTVFHDNVNLFTTKHGLLARYTVGEPYGHTFKDNVYVMELGKNFARSTQMLEGVPVDNANLDYTFDEYGIREAIQAGIDTTSVFRYTLPEGMTEESVFAPERLTFEEYIKYGDYYMFTAGNGEKYPTRILKPENFDEKRKYPLLVYLHAEYQRGDDGSAHVLNTNPLLTMLYTEQTEDDVVILAMQCPKGKTWTDTEIREKTYVYPEKEPEVLSALNELVDLVIAGNAGVIIDENNISIAGQSNGATAVYDVLARHGDKYNRAVIGGGSAVSGIVLGDTDVRVYHGKKDTQFKESDVSASIKALGGNVEYICRTSDDHSVWKRGFDRELALWLIDAE